MTADSGMHQFLLRAHFPVLAPGSLVVPANYQSMGFGIPAAIGAALATGERTVAVVGDGGLNIAGFELLTAARSGARVTVVVLVDRHFGLIRAQQLRRAGNAFGVDIPVADLRLLAESLGAGHVLVDDLEGADLRRALGRRRRRARRGPDGRTGADREGSRAEPRRLARAHDRRAGRPRRRLRRAAAPPDAFASCGTRTSTGPRTRRLRAGPRPRRSRPAPRARRAKPSRSAIFSKLTR